MLAECIRRCMYICNFVIDMKRIFLFNDEKVDSFYVFIILIMHRIFKQQKWSKIKWKRIEDN